MIVRNWKQMWKSYAVLLPALVSAILIMLDATVASGLIPASLTPVLILLSAFAGRVVKQHNLANKQKRGL